MRVSEADVAPEAHADLLVRGGARGGRARAVDVRRAGEELDQGKELAGLAKPTSRSTACCASASPALRRRTAGCRRKARGRPARLAARRVWIVDPIDGTRAYLAGHPDWSISAALVEDGRPVAAALFAPATDELFLAVKGRGATRNGAPIQASAGRAPRRCASRRAAAPSRAAGRSGTRLSPWCRKSTRSPCALRASPTAARCRLGRSEQPRLGPCGGRPFGARSRRRD